MSQSTLSDIWASLHNNNDIIYNDVSNEFLCAICKKILRKACSGPCGCRYCMECITAYLNGEEKFCPTDMDDCRGELINIDRNILVDQPMDRRIGRMIVKCPEINCQFRDQLRNMEEHVRVCRERASQCPYAAIGCSEVHVEGDKMIDHLRSATYSHSILLAESMNHFTNEMESLKKVVAELMKENAELKEELRSIKANEERNEIAMSGLATSIDEMRVRDIATLNEDVVALGDVHRSMRRDIDALKTEGGSQQARMTKRNAENERYATEASQNNVGTFSWPIEQWSNKLKTASGWFTKEVFSNAFYSHDHGYRMCLRLEHAVHSDKVAVYLCLLRGRFDDQLRWPFACTVTISVVNPVSRFIYGSKTMKFDCLPHQIGLRKPQSDRNEPIRFQLDVSDYGAWRDGCLYGNDLLSVECRVHDATDSSCTARTDKIGV